MATKMKVYEIAKSLNRPSKDLLKALNENGFEVKSHNSNIEDDAIEFIARRSAGGLRDALALLDQSTVLALENKSITKKDIVTLLGSVDDEDLYKLVVSQF